MRFLKFLFGTLFKHSLKWCDLKQFDILKSLFSAFYYDKFFLTGCALVENKNGPRYIAFPYYFIIKYPSKTLEKYMRYILFLSAFLLLFSVQAQAQQEDSNIVVPAYDARLDTYEYGYNVPVKYFPITSQGQDLEMAYIYLDGAEDKPVITLLHGKNFNADYWTETAEYLVSLGYNVLIPDQIGFGKSSKPRHYQFSFATLAQHTRDLQKSLGIKQSIIMGHSMGGMLASRYALMFPEYVSKLVLVNPIGLENYLHYVEYKDTDFFYKNELSKTPESIRTYQRKNYYDGQWNDRYDALTHFMIGQVKGPDSDRVAWVNALTYDMIFTQPVIEEFKDISVPTALIIGTRDTTGPGRGWKKEGTDYTLGQYNKLGKKAAQLIPNAELHEMEGLGHLPHIEDFAHFAEILKNVLNGTEEK